MKSGCDAERRKTRLMAEFVDRSAAMSGIAATHAREATGDPRDRRDREALARVKVVLVTAGRQVDISFNFRR
jgi:hypothetical protein